MRGRTIARVSVSLSAAAEEPVGALLERLFAQPACIETDFESGTTQAAVYLTGAGPGHRRKMAVLKQSLRKLRSDGLDIGSGRVRCRSLRWENWAESWKRHFPPLEIGGRLLVKPPWSKRRPKAGQAVVVLNPGLSFGTGQHPTTSYCLEQLTRWRDKQCPQAFLDLGTGSGILAIAAAKLGYAPVAALDNDPEAIRIAGRNAARNRISHRIRLARRDLAWLKPPPVGRFDVLCANLVYDLLLAHKTFILASLRTTGVLILSGILRSQFSEVVRAYCGEGLALVDSGGSGEWQSATFTKVGKSAH